MRANRKEYDDYYHKVIRHYWFSVQGRFQGRKNWITKLYSYSSRTTFKIIQELLNRFSIPELPLNSKRTSISTMKHILTFYLQNWNINCFKNIRLHKIMFYKHGRFMGIWYWHDSLRKKLIWKLVTIFWWNLRYPDLLLCITMI